MEKVREIVCAEIRAGISGELNRNAEPLECGGRIEYLNRVPAGVLSQIVSHQPEYAHG